MKKCINHKWILPASMLLLGALACSTQAIPSPFPTLPSNPATITADIPTPVPEQAPTVASQSGLSLLWRVSIPGNATPNRMDVDLLGDVYLAAGLGGAYIFDRDSNVLEDFASGDGRLIADIKMDLYGNLLLADPAHHQVIVASPGGEFLGSFGRAGMGDGEFGQNSPLVLEVNPNNNNFYLLNENSNGTQLQIYDGSEGWFMLSYPLEGGLFPDMDFGDDTFLYVLDQTNALILKIDSESGQVIQRLGAEALAGTSPRGIALDASGNFYISVNSSPSQVAIFVLDPQGSQKALIGELTSVSETEWPQGRFFDPRGIGVTPDGHFLFLCDGTQGRTYLTAYQLEN